MEVDEEEEPEPEEPEAGEDEEMPSAPTESNPFHFLEARAPVGSGATSPRPSTATSALSTGLGGTSEISMQIHHYHLIII